MEFISVDSGSEDNIFVGIEKVEEWFERYAEDYEARQELFGDWACQDLDSGFLCLDQDSMHQPEDCFPFEVWYPSFQGEAVGNHTIPYSFYGLWESFDGVIVAPAGLDLEEILGDKVWEGGWRGVDIHPDTLLVPYRSFTHISLDEVGTRFAFELKYKRNPL